MSNLDFDVRPVTGRIGAEITGVDLASDLDDVTVKSVRAALLEHRVVFFRGQELDSDRLISFGERFGPVTNGHPTIPGPEHNPRVQDIQYPPGGACANSWHSDVSFVEHPPLGSILRAIVVPPYGGDTLWANTVAGVSGPSGRAAHPRRFAVGRAHERLRLRRRRRSRNRQRRGGGLPGPLRVRPCSGPVTPSCRCTPRPASGRCSSACSPRALEGFSTADAQRLLAIFQESITTPENTVRWRWSPGDVAFWDNRTTQHYGVADFGDLTRQHERITISGGVPVSIDGRSSESLAGSDAAFTRVG